VTRLGVEGATDTDSPEARELELDAIPSRARVSDDVYRGILGAVFSRRLRPGSRLSVPALATQLGVSRTPVREAIIRLVHEGVAVEEPRRGAVVAELRLPDLVLIYEPREVLEGLAARMASERADKDALRRIRDACERHRSAVKDKHIEALFEADMDFHEAIWAATLNGPLMAMLKQLEAKIRIAMLTTAAVSSGPEHALADHERILAAIEAHDPKRAEEAARAHITRLRGLLERQLV
jgi:DNA-binding GntR family transcriptional regulator